MSVIVSELHLLGIKREQLFRDAVIFDQPFFGIGPEALQAIDVDLARTEPPLMVDSEMPVTAEHQGVVTTEFVGIDDASPADHLDRQTQENLGRDIANDLDFDLALTLENAEDRDFTSRSTSPVALAPPAEVGLIRLDLASEEEHTILAEGRNAFPYQVEPLEDRGVRQIDLLGCLKGRYLKLEEFNDPEPVSGRYPELPDPPSGPVGELVPAVLAAIFLAPDIIEFFAVTSQAKTTPPFPAGSGYVPPGPNF